MRTHLSYLLAATLLASVSFATNANDLYEREMERRAQRALLLELREIHALRKLGKIESAWLGSLAMQYQFDSFDPSVPGHWTRLQARMSEGADADAAAKRPAKSGKAQPQHEKKAAPQPPAAAKRAAPDREAKPVSAYISADRQYGLLQNLRAKFADGGLSEVESVWLGAVALQYLYDEFEPSREADWTELMRRVQSAR